LVSDAEDGRFWAQFAVEDAELKYSKDWPRAKAVNGDVAIAGRTLSGSLSAARFGDSPLESAHFELPDLFHPEPVMTVEGRIRARLPNVLTTLKNSPLASRSVPSLSPLTLEGEVDLDLDMRLGLKKGMRRDVSGRINFEDNTLQTSPGGLRFTELNGVISFAPEGWSGEALSARLGTRAVGIEVGNVLDANQRPAPSFTLTGTATRDELLNELQRRAPMVAKLLAPVGVEPLIDGTLAWRARLSGPVEARRLNLDSDLVGVALDLPSPLRKSAGSSLPFTLEMPYGVIPKDSDAITHVQLGDLLNATVRTEAIAAERNRVGDVLALCSKAGKADLAAKHIADGTSKLDLQSTLLDVLCANNKPIGEGENVDLSKNTGPDAKYKAEFEANAYLSARMSLEDYIASRKIDDGVEKLTVA
jgi:uncharacterized protein YhdP